MFEQRIKVNAKCSDMITVRLHDETSGRELVLEGEVPEFLGGGDYVRISIDLETGQIMDWPGKEAVLAAMKGDDDER